MAPTAWVPATVVDIHPETARAKTFRLRLPHPSPHRAGQHYVLRLTAPDGYTASRSYSVASPPNGSQEIELTVERLEDGEVSTFLHDELVVGDELELRGPIGGWFVWDATSPALLVGGGSGLVPLMCMLRLARNLGRSDLARLLVSVRSPADLLYAREVPGPETRVIYTRTGAPGDVRPPGRLTLADVEAVVEALPDGATAYVCGSSGFADAATDLLMVAGVAVDRIRVERFGATG